MMEETYLHSLCTNFTELRGAFIVGFRQTSHIFLVFSFIAEFEQVNFDCVSNLQSY